MNQHEVEIFTKVNRVTIGFVDAFINGIPIGDPYRVLAHEGMVEIQQPINGIYHTCAKYYVESIADRSTEDGLYIDLGQDWLVKGMNMIAKTVRCTYEAYKVLADIRTEDEVIHHLYECDAILDFGDADNDVGNVYPWVIAASSLGRDRLADRLLFIEENGL